MRYLVAILILIAGIAQAGVTGGGSTTGKTVNDPAPPESGGEIQISGLGLNRTSGVAPLYVHAIPRPNVVHEDGGIDVFFDLFYKWDYGDPWQAGDSWSETWAYSPSGMNKNIHYGPVGAHVFEDPGSYTITLDVTDANGNTAQRQEVVTVSDPDTVWSGANTVCIANDNTDWTGCPAGATQVQPVTEYDNVSGGVLEYLTSQDSIRVLLRRGDTFVSNQANSLCDGGPKLLGAFGSGDKPTVTYAGAQDIQRFGWPASCSVQDDWRYVDIEFDGLNSGFSVMHYGNNSNHLFLRVDSFNSGGACIEMIQRRPWEYADGQPGLALVENDYNNCDGLGMWAATNAGAFMGNRVQGTFSASVRVGHFIDSRFSQNTIEGPSNDGQNVFKFYAQTTTESGTSWITPGYYDRTQYNVFADNKTFGGDGNSEVFGLEPVGSSTCYPDDVRNNLVERNWFTGWIDTGKFIVVGGPDNVIRNNVFDHSTAAGRVGAYEVLIERRTACHPAPARTVICNNTSLHNANMTNGIFAQITTNDAADTIVQNNLARSYDAMAANWVTNSGASGLVQTPNYEATSNPFVVATPTNFPDDFKVQSPNAGIIDAGTGACSFGWDAFGTVRPQGSDGDHGFHEQ